MIIPYSGIYIIFMRIYSHRLLVFQQRITCVPELLTLKNFELQERDESHIRHLFIPSSQCQADSSRAHVS
jgi:hypothetical protein